MLIDTHAHLNFKAYKKDLDTVIDQAQKSGVERIIIPGAKIDSSQKAVEIAQKYPQCFAAIGIHPHHISEYIQSDKDNIYTRLQILVNNKKVVAIGEIGLDYHGYKGYPPITDEIKSLQKELLMLQIDIAIKFNLPIIFHCRDAYDEQLSIIKDKKLDGVFHCFGGDRTHLKKIINLGLYVGFDGNITYPENQILKDLVKITPLDRLVLESDSPFLTPIPHRGKRNEPSYLAYTAESVAQMHEISIEDLMPITNSNAVKLFRLPISNMIK